MTAKLNYQWHLRELMAARGMFSTTDLRPLLAERGSTSRPARSSGWSPRGPSG